MKKKLLLGSIAVLITIAGAFGVSALSDSQMEQEYGKGGVETDVDTNMEIDNDQLLSSEELREVVHEIVEGKIEEIELESKKGRLVFEVDVEDVRDEDVEVYVDAYTGEIVHIDDDRKNTEKQETKAESASIDVERNISNVSDQPKEEKQVAKNDSNNKSTSKDNDSEFIGHERAIAIAKEIEDGKVVEFEFEKDDGRFIYEVEIKQGGYEVEVEIDAKTGKVLEVEYDD